MARSLAGMMNQLNQAIQQQPTGEGLLDLTSQYGGRLAGGMMDADPFQFMNTNARQMEGQSQLQNIDPSTPAGMAQAAQIYQKMGDTQTALQLSDGARKMQEAQYQQVAQRKVQASLLDTVHKDSTIPPSEKQTYYDAINSGQIKSRNDLIDWKMYDPLKRAQLAKEQASGRKSQIVDIQTANGPLKVNYDTTTDQITGVVGAGKKDASVIKAVNPNTGRLENAVIDQQNPQAGPQFVGRSAEDQFTVKENKDNPGTYDILDDRGNLLRTEVSDAAEAKKFKAQMQTVAKAGNVRRSIAGARDIVRNSEWNQPVAGLTGALSSAVPGTSAYDLNLYLNSIRANVGFNELRELREAGGTLGQVSNIENLLLQSVIDNIDIWASEGRLEEALERIDSHMMNMQKMALGESPVQTIDWNAPEYQDLGVEKFVDDDGTTYIRLPDGNIIQ